MKSGKGQITEENYQIKKKSERSEKKKFTNTWEYWGQIPSNKAILLIRYSGPFLKWTREELQQMDQRTRKLMTMHKALNPKDDIDRQYVSRKEGGSELASIEDSVDASI